MASDLFWVIAMIIMGVACLVFNIKKDPDFAYFLLVQLALLGVFTDFAKFVFSTIIKLSWSNNVYSLLSRQKESHSGSG